MKKPINEIYQNLSKFHPLSMISKEMKEQVFIYLQSKGWNVEDINSYLLADIVEMLIKIKNNQI